MGLLVVLGLRLRLGSEVKSGAALLLVLEALEHASNDGDGEGDGGQRKCKIASQASVKSKIRVCKGRREEGW